MQIRTLKQNHLDVFASSSENQYLLKNVFRRTMPDIHEYFQPIEDKIANKFIPEISGGCFSTMLNVNSYHYQQDMDVYQYQ